MKKLLTKIGALFIGLIIFVAVIVVAAGQLRGSIGKEKETNGDGTAVSQNETDTGNIQNHTFANNENSDETSVSEKNSSITDKASEIVDAAETSLKDAANAFTGKDSSSTSAKNKNGIAEYEYSYAGFTPQYADTTVDFELILVNRDYILPDDYVPKLDYSIADDTSSKKLDYRVAPYYNEMYQAAAKEGIYLTTVSGYRSYEKQKTNFENKIQLYKNQGMGKIEATQAAAKIILPPGTSEHNAGLAMDIISLEQSFENTKEFKWLNENAQDYGFILRYPKDKQDITEIIYEPWHWRYVGVENAKKIKASGQTLEEYLGVK